MTNKRLQSLSRAFILLISHKETGALIESALNMLPVKGREICVLSKPKARKQQEKWIFLAEAFLYMDRQIPCGNKEKKISIFIHHNIGGGNVFIRFCKSAYALDSTRWNGIQYTYIYYMYNCPEERA